MTIGYYLSTSWSQHFHQIFLVSVYSLPQFFCLSVLFNRGISRSISVIFPTNLRSISRRISASYNHGMVLFSG
mgnify:CR=1 FL=1